jgi:hypothetical protein
MPFSAMPAKEVDIFDDSQAEKILFLQTCIYFNANYFQLLPGSLRIEHRMFDLRWLLNVNVCVMLSVTIGRVLSLMSLSRCLQIPMNACVERLFCAFRGWLISFFCPLHLGLYLLESPACLMLSFRLQLSFKRIPVHLFELRSPLQRVSY